MNQALFVGGVVSISTVDYPDHISFVVFLQGCPWRCRYCHNPHLQNISPSESLPWEDILSLIRTRVGFIEAVVFSGGEPLMQPGLFDAILDIRKIGLKIGLHTSGAFPKMLSKVVSYIDWIGFDIKTAFDEYATITNVQYSGNLARESLQIILESNIDFETRITMDSSISIEVIVGVLKEIASMGVKNVVLQKCRDKDEIVIEHPIFSDKLLLEDISKCFDSFFIR